MKFKIKQKNNMNECTKCFKIVNLQIKTKEPKKEKRRCDGIRSKYFCKHTHKKYKFLMWLKYMYTFTTYTHETCPLNGSVAYSVTHVSMCLCVGNTHSYILTEYNCPTALDTHTHPDEQTFLLFCVNFGVQLPHMPCMMMMLFLLNLCANCVSSNARKRRGKVNEVEEEEEGTGVV